jgi:hypothetical protein
MPRSRNWKTPKKKAHKQRPVSGRKPVSQTETIDGIRYEQTGNMTYIQNIRSEKEQEDYLKRLKENHPHLKTYLTGRINAVIELFTAYDKIARLGALNYNHYVLQDDPNDDGVSEIILEYAMSIAAAIPDKADLPLPKASEMPGLISQLEEIRHLFLQYYMAESVINSKFSESETPAISKLRFDVMIEALTIRGTGYYDHVTSLFLELFSLHDDFFVKEYGFKAADIVSTVEHIEKSFSSRLAGPDGQHSPAAYEQLWKWMEENHIFPPVPTPEVRQRFALEHPVQLSFDFRVIATYQQLFLIRPRNETEQKVVDALSLKFGDNAEYLSGDIPANLMASTKIREKPILKDAQGNAYLFSFAIASRNWMQIGQKLIEEKNASYYQQTFQGNKKFISKDAFFERKVTALFKTFLQDVEFFPNVKYPLSSIAGRARELTELDLLGVGPEELYLIEIKAGELNEAARRGATGSLLTRLKNNIGKGHSQSERAKAYILTGENPVFKDGKKEIAADPAKKIYRIIITLDNFSGLLGKLAMLEETDVISGSTDYAWITHIYDLLIFAAIIEGRRDFNDFLDKRLPLNAWKGFQTHDEINLLAHFLDEELEFPAEKRKLDTFTLGNYLSDINRYFYDVQIGRHSAKPSRKNKPSVG